MRRFSSTALQKDELKYDAVAVFGLAIVVLVHGNIQHFLPLSDTLKHIAPHSVNYFYQNVAKKFSLSWRSLARCPLENTTNPRDRPMERACEKITSDNTRQTMAPKKPCDELTEILIPAYAAEIADNPNCCASANSACSCMKAHFKNGLLARGYTGAFGKIEDVELVLVLAEPGNPTDYETVGKKNPKHIIADSADEIFRKWIAAGATPFHRNLQTILAECWKKSDCWNQTVSQSPEIMRRTWITESVLCSAAGSTKRIEKSVEMECAKNFLLPQLLKIFQKSLHRPFIVALGGKAAKRMEQSNIDFDFKAAAPGLPGGNFPESKASWKKLGAKFRQQRARKQL